MTMKQDQLENTAVIAGKTTWLGAWVAGIFGGLSINEAVAIGGFGIAIAGWATNLWYRHRADQRAQRLYELREKRLLAGKSDHGTLDELESNE
jgi:hypothetical protein